MKTLPEVPDNSDLKREVEALRKRIEALESGRARPKVAGGATRWRWLAAKPALALTAVMGAVLALGVLSAQNKPDPLLIDPNGNVSMGSARFSKIGVNQTPQEGQKVTITADGTDIPFNVTNKDNNVKWLAVLKDGQVVMNGGNVGIGKPNPDVPLDVKGEIRGRPWSSREYEWKQGQQGEPGFTRMTKADRSVCFLTAVGAFTQVVPPYTSEVGIIKGNDGYWILYGGQAKAKAVCIGAPDDSW